MSKKIKIGAALGGVTGGVLGALADKKKKKPTPVEPGEMPMLESPEVEEAKRRSIARQRKRRGRAYTVLG